MFCFQERVERGRAGAVDHGGDIVADDVARSPTHCPSPKILAHQLRLLQAGCHGSHLVPRCLHRRNSGKNISEFGGFEGRVMIVVRLGTLYGDLTD